MNICEVCGSSKGSGECQECAKILLEAAVAARKSYDRTRCLAAVAPDMLKQLQRWVGASVECDCPSMSECNCAWSSRMFPESPKVTCNICDTLALLARIEEV